MPESDRALVRNAADPQQVKFAARKERDELDRDRAALKLVLATYEGRYTLRRLLEKAGVYRSVWHPSAAIHYNAGRQDFGHELMAALVDCDEELFQLMETEARARHKRVARETDATHTPRAETKDVNNA